VSLRVGKLIPAEVYQGMERLESIRLSESAGGVGREVFGCINKRLQKHLRRFNILQVKTVVSTKGRMMLL
jgi:hypothetical protein